MLLWRSSEVSDVFDLSASDNLLTSSILTVFPVLENQTILLPLRLREAREESGLSALDNADNLVALLLPTEFTAFWLDKNKSTSFT
jgi:hypothetical protein